MTAKTEEKRGAESEKKEAENRSDPIISILGHDLGPWQLYICLLIFLNKFPTGWVQLSMVFLNNPIDHKCAEPSEADVCSNECKKIEYNRTIFEENVVTQWDLVCERQSLASMSQSLVMVGIMMGNMVFGVLADRYGRRPTFVLACVLQLLTGVTVSVSPWFSFYCLFRFLVAFSTGATMCTGFVIVMECVGKSYRELMTILYQIPFNIGHASLPLFAYFFRHWRWYHLSFSCVSVIYLIYFWLVPESPRWLLTTGQLDKSAAILEKGAARNNMPTSNIRADLEVAYQRQVSRGPVKKGSMMDLFRYPYLRQKTLAMAFNWLVVCMTYYGVSQYITTLSGDIFINVAIGGTLGIPGTIICVPLTKYVGRKPTLIISNTISAVSLIAMACIPDITPSMKVLLATIGLFGASVTFPNVYLYGGELFPTMVRPTGVGLCSFVGRVGSILAPFITQLSQLGFWISPLVFGTFSLLAALAVFLLPETKGQILPETIEDGENFGRKRKEPEPISL